MDSEAKKFLDKTFVEIHTLKKGKVTLVFNLQDRHVYVKKVARRNPLPYRELEKISHPGLPQIYYVCENAGKTYVIQEYINGDNLAEILHGQGHFSEEQVLNIALQVADILIHIHKKDLIHRDIKPSNIILNKYGSIKLIDFDAARITSKNKESDTYFLGTQGYAPPEQYGFAQTDARSDIYSLGITLKELLPPNYQGYLLDIIANCTKIDPEQRIQSAQKLKTLLQKQQTADTVAGGSIFLIVLLIFLLFFSINYAQKAKQPAINAYITKTSEFFCPNVQQTVEIEAAKCSCFPQHKAQQTIEVKVNNLLSQDIINPVLKLEFYDKHDIYLDTFIIAMENADIHFAEGVSKKQKSFLQANNSWTIEIFLEKILSSNSHFKLKIYFFSENFHDLKKEFYFEM